MEICRNLFKPLSLAMVVALASCGSDDKPQPVPPVDYALKYINDLFFEQDVHLYTTVPESYSYRTPKDGSDCAQGTRPEEWFWVLDGGTPDYLELTISDYLGVDPGKSRGYTLAHHGTQTTTYDLVFKQSPGTQTLHFMTWRIKLNANEDLASEKGDGNSNAAPGIGLAGFERKWKGVDTLIGGDWELRPADSFDLRGITARLHVNIDNGGIKVCR